MSSSIKILQTSKKTTLRDDLANKSEFDQIFSQITNPVDRAYVLHMVRTLGNIDEDYDEKERAAFKRVEAKIQSSVNITDKRAY